MTKTKKVPKKVDKSKIGSLKVAKCKTKVGVGLSNEFGTLAGCLSMSGDQIHLRSASQNHNSGANL